MQWLSSMPKTPHPLTGARLTSAVLGYFLAVTAVVTLVPFRFEIPAQFGFTMRGTRFDLIANLLLFLPSGFLYRLWRPPVRDRMALTVLMLGLFVSLLIECAQLFEPDRFASPIDVAANMLGAWAGALLCDVVTSRIHADSVLVGRLSLEIPLMGLAYMLVPLLWVGGLAAGNSIVSLTLLLFPCLFGATILVFVHRYRLGTHGGESARRMAMAAGLGTIAGLSPAATRHFAVVMIIALVVAVFTAAGCCIDAAGMSGERRFERRALRAASPFFAAYLVALLVVTARTRVALAMPHPAAILRALELIAAFTVLGYLLAEWHGRLNQNALNTIAGVLLRTMPVAAIALAIQYFTQLPAGLPLFAAMLLAAAFGGGLYNLQRAHVRALIARTPRASAHHRLRRQTAA
jgi:glycopeptide antibiotics resistance protein